jgi:aminoglycoside phosphotransferase family enzyme/predicted kinase
MAFRVEEHLDQLRHPACFGNRGPVEVLQTHISVVCLAGDRAFKFKKAVDLPFLDFSTPAARRRACEDELRLNRRLAPDVYLGVAPLVRSGDGDLRVGGRVEHAVDWCVEMCRLPQERMLDELLDADRVEEGEIRRLARLVADFHRRAAEEADGSVHEAGSPARLAAQVRANFDEVAGLDDRCLDPGLVTAVRERVERALPELERRLESRAQAGRIVEGHGDLHARNICMVDPPVIYDCIEFRLDFRAGDVAADVAFLVMDLRHRGHRELGDVFIHEYVAASGDADIVRVLPELVRYRAMVRAKVGAIASSEESLPEADRERARSAARRHLRLCAWTLVEEQQARLVIGCGLPASGKTTVLTALAEETGWPRIGTDGVRKELAGLAPEQRLGDEFYATEFSDRTYAEVLRRCTAAEDSAIADGNFGSEARRQQAAAAASMAGKLAQVVEVRVPESVARDRLRHRETMDDRVSDADESVFEFLRHAFESPRDAIEVDGTAPVEDALDRLATRMLA